MIAAFRNRNRETDDGFSLIELVVVTSIFLMIMTVITASVISMMSQARRESGQSDNMTNSRNIIQDLDKTVRYANNISTPGTGSDGSYYVEYRTGNTGQQQTCWQWRYNPTTKLVQSRHWLPPLAGVGSTTATTWAFQADGIALSGATPIWTITTPSASSSHEVLNVKFIAKHGGGPVQSTASQVTLTAINTASSSPLSSPTCTEVGRP
jgi:prepilin-type N-terminal cleavage/methylation domain-containing protein